jgi:hypothetical protein
VEIGAEIGSKASLSVGDKNFLENEKRNDFLT